MKSKLLFFLLLTALSFSSVLQGQTAKNAADGLTLSEEDKAYLINLIEEIDEADQRYRTPISLGTLDTVHLKKLKEISKNGTIKEYIAFEKSVPKTLGKNQIDSLWKLQAKIDYDNYLLFKTILSKYGYPSPERLGVKTDKLYAILLHPPSELQIEDYVEEMVSLLKVEMERNRFPAINFATFYDNMKAKILKQPQLYGTNKSFDFATMTPGLPIIEDIEKTNAARANIGLGKLKEGEYELVKKKD